MVRIGKFDEDKILFKSTGHDHSGGSAGAYISKIDSLTCLRIVATSIAATASIYTGLTSVRSAWVQEVATAAATAALVTATSGGTVSVTPGAAGQTLWVFAVGYA
jgi:hypothetical protein